MKTVKTNSQRSRPATQPDPLMKYRFFKRLLASNNAILEEMSLLERMIYEGRSFTQEEALHRVQSLIDHGCSLIEDLNALAGTRYAGLFPRLRIIAGEALKAVARERTFDGQDLVLSLDAISWTIWTKWAERPPISAKSATRSACPPRRVLP